MKINKKVLLFPMLSSSLIAKITSRRYWQLIVSLVILITFSGSLISPAIAEIGVTTEIAANTEDEDNANEKVKQAGPQDSSPLSSITSITQQAGDMVSFLHQEGILTKLSKLFAAIMVGIENNPDFNEVSNAIQNKLANIDVDESNISAEELATLHIDFEKLNQTVAESVLKDNQELKENIKEALTNIEGHLTQHPININPDMLTKDIENIKNTMDKEHSSVDKDKNVSSKEEKPTTTLEFLKANHPGIMAFLTAQYPEFLKPNFFWNGWYHFFYAFTYKFFEIPIKEVNSNNPYVRWFGIDSLITAYSAAKSIPPISKSDKNFFLGLLGKTTAVATHSEKEMFIKYFTAKVGGEVTKNIVMIILLERFSRDTYKDSFNYKFSRELLANLVETWFLDKWNTCDIMGRCVKALLLSPKYEDNQKYLATIAPHIGALGNSMCKGAKYSMGLREQDEIAPPPVADPKNYYCISQLKEDGSSNAVCDNGSQHKISIVDKINSKSKSTFLVRNLGVGNDNAFPMHTAYETLFKDKILLTSKLPIAIIGFLPNISGIVDQAFSKILSPLFFPTRTINKDQQVSVDTNALTLDNVTINNINNSNAAILKLTNKTNKTITITKIQHLPHGPEVLFYPTAIQPGITQNITLSTGFSENIPYALSMDYIIGNKRTGKYLHGMIWFKLATSQKVSETTSIPDSNIRTLTGTPQTSDLNDTSYTAPPPVATPVLRRFFREEGLSS